MLGRPGSWTRRVGGAAGRRRGAAAAPAPWLARGGRAPVEGGPAHPVVGPPSRGAEVAGARPDVHGLAGTRNADECPRDKSSTTSTTSTTVGRDGRRAESSRSTTQEKPRRGRRRRRLRQPLPEAAAPWMRRSVHERQSGLAYIPLTHAWRTGALDGIGLYII